MTQSAEGAQGQPTKASRELTIPIPTWRSISSAISQPRALSIVSLLLAIFATAASLEAYRAVRGGESTARELAVLHKSLDSLHAAVLIDELTTSAISEPAFSLRESSLQNAGDGFEVGHLAITNEPGGAKVTGLIINTKAISFRGISFKLNVDGKPASVWLQNLAAGGSAKFSVVVEGASATEARFGTLSFDNATTSYRAPD